MNSGKIYYGNHTIISKQSKCKTLYESDRVMIDLMYLIDSKYDVRNEVKKSDDVMHLHSMHELHLIKRGEVVYEIETGERIAVGKNSFVIIPPSLKHRIERESDDFDKIIMRFDISSLEEDRDSFYNTAIRYMKAPKLYKCSGRMTKLLNVIGDISKSDSHDKYNMVFNLCISCIMEICNVVVHKRNVRKDVVSVDNRVQDAVKFIKNNISVAITASDVATAVYLSPQHLSRIFKENIGMTPSKYIRMAKNEYICKLLMETDLSLANIAELVGVPDSSALIKRFKRTEGNTPKKYKQTITK